MMMMMMMMMNIAQMTLFNYMCFEEMTFTEK